MQIYEVAPRAWNNYEIAIMAYICLVGVTVVWWPW